MMMPSSVTSVSPASGKLGLAPVSHTLNTGAEGSASISHATLHRKAGGGGGFLMPLLCVGPFVQNVRRVNILDMSDERTDQSILTTLILLILVRCVLALSS